jgi:hypothetical protein
LPIREGEPDLLTPYAVGFRYADQPSPFDRLWAVNLVSRIRAWARRIILEG